MEPKYNKDAFQQRINELDHRSALAFGLSCAERLYRNYVKFSQDFNWGEPKRLREILDKIWNYMQTDIIDFSLDDEKEKCEDLMPDTEDFQTILVSSALDASSAVLMLLDYISNHDAQSIGDISSICNDTVDMYVQELLDIKQNDPYYEAKILDHTLMQTELIRQRENIEHLKKMPLDNSTYFLYQEKWRCPKVSNIGL